MRVIERSDLRDEDGTISFQNRLKGTLNYGLKWYSEIQAQLDLTEKLSRTLQSEHTLVRNLRIEHRNLVIPMILISPQGVSVIVPNTTRGVFRAKGDEWQTFDSGKRQFKRARPNPMIEARQMADIVLQIIQEQGYGLPEAQPILMFTDPSTHVDQARPGIRIVQTDAIDHFAANHLKAEPIMDQEDIHALTEALIHPRLPEPEPAPEGMEVPESRPLPGAESDLSSLDPFYTQDPQSKSPALGAPWYARWGLSRRQWILLAVMAFAEILILIALVVIVVANTFYS